MKFWETELRMSRAILICVVLISLPLFAIFKYSEPSSSTATEKTRYYLEELDKDPRNPTSYNNLGWIYFQQDKFDNATKLFNQALKLSPNNITSRYNLALVSLRLNNLKGAKQQLVEILRISPEHDLALLQLAQINLMEKDYAEARLTFKRYLRLNPTSANALKGLGESYEGLGQLEKAKAAYKLALKFVPDYKKVQEAISLLEEKQGDN